MTARVGGFREMLQWARRLTPRPDGDDRRGPAGPPEPRRFGFLAHEAPYELRRLYIHKRVSDSYHKRGSGQSNTDHRTVMTQNPASMMNAAAREFFPTH